MSDAVLRSPIGGAYSPVYDGLRLFLGVFRAAVHSRRAKEIGGSHRTQDTL